MRHTRRQFLRASIVGPAMGAVAGPYGAWAQDRRPRATPVCGDDGVVTPPQTAGPFFKPRSPLRTSLLEPGMAGPRLVLEGSVLTLGCTPIRGALLDFWQADVDGHYDNDGYRLRGHQLSDDAGRFRLETVVPAAYPGRTRHIHVNVQAPGQPVLTTQLYFPGEPANQRDPIFHPDLVVKVREGEGRQTALYAFVLDDQLAANRGRGRR
jgi:protocatechuate 3,4-dioxygenase beta subunit